MNSLSQLAPEPEREESDPADHTDAGKIDAGQDIRRGITAVDGMLVAMSVIFAILVATGVVGPLRVTLGALAASFVPGWAIVRWFRTKVNWLAAIAVSVGLSATLAALVGSLLLLANAWNPTAYVIALCIVSVAATLIPAPRDTSVGLMWFAARQRSRSDSAAAVNVTTRSERRTKIILCVLLVISVILWLGFLRPVTETDLGDYGLLPVLSAGWYIALAIVLVVAGWAYLRKFPVVQAAALACFTFMLYATSTIIEAAPRLAYVYKHIAVVRLFEVTGMLHPSVDIYNRWPGFFAAAGLFDTWTGLDSPISYVAIAETVFALVDAVLVFMLARSFAMTTRNAVLAASVFTAANWVGQGYFSPQAFAFSLFLLMAVLITRYLRGEPTRLGRWVERLVGRIVRPRSTGPDAASAIQGESLSPSRFGDPRTALIVGILVAIEVAIVISHQLTPYIALLGIAPLCLIGLIRPRLIGVAFAAMSIGFLVPNFEFVQSRYGIFTGFNFVQNATASASGVAGNTVADSERTDVYLLLTAIVAVLALVGLVLRARTGDLRGVVFVAWMSVSPVFILAGQSYGGEGRLRAVLFALPWLSIGVGWLAQSTNWRLLRNRVGLGVSIAVIAALFTFAWLQPEADDLVPKADVQAAEWISDHVTARDFVVSALPASNLDDLLDGLLIDWRYPVVLTTQENSYDLTYALSQPSLDEKLTGLAKVDSQLADGAKIYIVFSDADAHDDAIHKVQGYAQLPAFEKDIAALPSSKLVYSHDGDRVYSITR